MKNILKCIWITALLLVGVLCVTACSQWNTPYEVLEEDGYTLSVRYDANGGAFAGTNDVSVVDVFNLKNERTGADGKVEITLLSPDDDRRGNTAFEISRNGYFLLGWYTERTLRTDENGVALDDWGEPVSESGREQGYVYGNRWDFENGTLTVDPNGTYTAEEEYITLYAAWAPYFVFEIYAEGEDGELTQCASTEALTLNVPAWNEKTGKLDMKNFPKQGGKTLEAVYTSSQMTDEVIGSLTGQVDLERGISLTPYIQVYTTWREGEWFRIYTPEQFYSNTRLDGCYEIMCDLDFADSYYWSNTLAKGTFIGKINGNGYTVSNVSVVQADNTQRLGGLFGALGATANVQDITFENVTYTVQAGSRNEGPSYGLLAGEIHTQATLTGVTVSGTLKIDPAMLIPTDYNIGILSGNGENRDIDISGITCVKTDEADTTLNVSVDETGNVKLTRAEQ